MPAEPTLRRLQRRPEFLRVRYKGRRSVAPGLVLQACPARAAATGGPVGGPGGGPGSGPAEIGIGLTASKKVGNAVERNRARRRLRALATGDLKRLARPGTDYVLIARRATLTRPWPELRRDLRDALKRLKKLRRPDGATDGETGAAAADGEAA
ncbi:MAG: ribonuclease P protein component [Rhodospirillaceae bacterium]|nr:ribonuclease P protein component [Rhodospirillaceae bacterium]